MTDDGPGGSLPVPVLALRLLPHRLPHRVHRLRFPMTMML